MGRECPPPRWGRSLGAVPLPRKLFNFGSLNVHFGAFCGSFDYLLLHCNTPRYRPPPTLIFQVDCGSIKDAGVPTEEGTKHYLLWW